MTPNVIKVLIFIFLTLFSTASLSSELMDLSAHSTIQQLAKEFIKVKPGQFFMGSNKGRDNEQPEHSVKITQPYELAKYEVTQALWLEVMGKTVADQLEIMRKAIGKPNHQNLRGVGDDHPVYLVSWNETQVFLSRINAIDKIYFYRLPSEAEWEYAAKAGTNTLYSFGNDKTKLHEYAWYIENGEYHTHPVGLKKPNPWGFHDMHGNVSEWVQDRADDYSSRLQIDPRGPSATEDNRTQFKDCDNGPDRIMKGGSWGNPAHSSHSSRRTMNNPNSRSRGLGFRLVRYEK